VNAIAEMGLVLVLFAIGLELSLARVMRLGRVLVQGGVIQVAGTIAVVTGVAALAGAPPRVGVVFGALAAMSSTSILLKLYADRGALDAPEARLTIPILLFQDLCIIPLVLLVQLLGGGAAGWERAAVRIGASLAVVALLVLGGRVAVPLALGAFLAGLVISESEYGTQALSDVLPFRDTLTGIFFASVGMLLDVRFMAAHPGLAFGAAAVVLVWWSRPSWRPRPRPRSSGRCG
jgi:CPA2 family monovalent cation:H+ antiporter-2